MKHFKLKIRVTFLGMLMILIVFSCQDINLEDQQSEALVDLRSAVAGKYIVTLHSNEINFQKNGKYEDVQSWMRQLSNEVLFRNGIKNKEAINVYGYAFNGFSVDLNASEIELLNKDKGVKQIILDQSTGEQLNLRNNNPRRGGGDEPTPEQDPEPAPDIKPEWYLDRIAQRQLPLNGKFESNSTGAGVTVYMVGLPVSEELKEIFGERANNVDLTVGKDSVPEGFLSVGILKAAVLGGNKYGVAKGVNIVGLETIYEGVDISVDLYLKPLEWIMANGKRPGIVLFPGIAFKPGGELEDLLEKTIGKLFDDGFSFFANGWQGEHRCDLLPSKLNSVFTVGASSFDDRMVQSSSGSCIDLFAPGINYFKEGFPEYPILENLDKNFDNPASLAAGVAALYLEDKSNADPQEVYDFLFETSTKDVVRFSSSINNHLLYSGLDTIGAGEIDPKRNTYAFDLEASALKNRNNNYTVVFYWGKIESESGMLNVYQDGEGVGSVPNGGSYMINVSGRDLSPRTYKFCVPKTNLCSNEVVVSFN
ncbi:S8 family serine peptidase [Mongoliibacter ruber]|uniref:Peptidase inhibitor I9 n=1 Tax=Mongoliibacter ruber TaxID=1750599 RepID=A0A2T0WVW9_9BACT|nr:S8 family serine peptidase [Mongoliibacter ruber]PRY90835.1 peptidase inhibitor I9 [Mongoliibacter ruber]